MYKIMYTLVLMYVFFMQNVYAFVTDKKIRIRHYTFTDTKVALIISNSEYTYRGQLIAPPKDAKLIKDTLVNLGFRVYSIYDSDIDNLTRKLTEFHKVSKTADVSLIYYTGRGSMIDGKDYIVPINFNKQKISNGYLKKTNLLRKIFALDYLTKVVSTAKYFGAIFYDTSRINILPDVVKSTKDLNTMYKNVLISYASETNTHAADNSSVNKNHSPYALSVSEAIKLNANMQVKLDYISTRVNIITKGKQKPTYRGFIDTNIIDFSKNNVYSYTKSKYIISDNLMWQNEVYDKAEEKAYLSNSEEGKVQYWKNTISYCTELTLHQYSDWRLPTSQELKKLYSQEKPLTHIVSHAYWSSTVSNDAVLSYFDKGQSLWLTKSNSLYIRCVRDINASDVTTKNLKQPIPKINYLYEIDTEKKIINIVKSKK